MAQTVRRLRDGPQEADHPMPTPGSSEASEEEGRRARASRCGRGVAMGQIAGRALYFERAVGRQVVLGPGEGLFIPAGCWHHVRSLSPTMSISFWF